jgi:CarD family transcriptional regulator
MAEFSIGDKIVHPGHGPGRITHLEKKNLLDGKKDYYVINIPAKRLTLFIPRQKMDLVGIRPAMPRATLARVLEVLRSRPRQLSPDFRERQEVASEKLKTSEPIPIAEVVRDLTGHRIRAHLTRKDTELLAQGTELLASEMALVTDQEIEDARETILDALSSWELLLETS